MRLTQHAETKENYLTIWQLNNNLLINNNNACFHDIGIELALG